MSAVNSPTHGSTITARRQQIVEDGEGRCVSRLARKLANLAAKHRLYHSLTPNSGEFEVLEFYGDAVLYKQTSRFIMTTRRFMNPHLMTELRVQMIRNSNLACVYDMLSIVDLLRTSRTNLDPTAPAPLLDDKGKADVVEAIIGELAEHSEEDSTLRDLIAYIAFRGERDFHLRQQTLFSRSPPVSSSPTSPAPIDPVIKKRKQSAGARGSPPKSPAPISIPQSSTPVRSQPIQVQPTKGRGKGMPGREAIAAAVELGLDDETDEVEESPGQSWSFHGYVPEPSETREEAYIESLFKAANHRPASANAYPSRSTKPENGHQVDGGKSKKSRPPAPVVPQASSRSKAGARNGNGNGNGHGQAQDRGDDYEWAFPPHPHREAQDQTPARDRSRPQPQSWAQSHSQSHSTTAPPKPLSPPPLFLLDPISDLVLRGGGGGGSGDVLHAEAVQTRTKLTILRRPESPDSPSLGPAGRGSAQYRE